MSLDEILKVYEYDKSKPLNPQSTILKETEEYIVEKIYYDSTNNQRVPSLLVIPKKGSPPYPCIVFLHGYSGRKENVMPLAEVGVSRGFAFFSIDAPFHGERSIPGKELYSPVLKELIRNVVQTVHDLKRGVDLLETRNEIDSERIGYAGGSMGGIIGSLFVSVEPRIKAAVIVVGGGNLPLMIKESKHRSAPPIRERISREGISEDQLRKILAPIDPINFIHLVSPRPIQFHCGKYDEIVPAETQRQLAEKAGEPKEVYWYEAGHGLPMGIVVERAFRFFSKYLQ